MNRLKYLKIEIELFSNFLASFISKDDEVLAELYKLYAQAEDMIRSREYDKNNFHTKFNAIGQKILATIRYHVQNYVNGHQQYMQKFDGIRNFDVDIDVCSFSKRLKQYNQEMLEFYFLITKAERYDKLIWELLPREIQNAIFDKTVIVASVGEVSNLLKVNKNFKQFFAQIPIYQEEKTRQYIPHKNEAAWKDFIVKLRAHNLNAITDIEKTHLYEIKIFNISRYELLNSLFSAVENIIQLKQAIADNQKIKDLMDEFRLKFQTSFNVLSKECQQKYYGEAINQEMEGLPNEFLLEFQGKKMHLKIKPYGLINKSDIIDVLQVFIFQLALQLNGREDGLTIIKMLREKQDSFFANIIQLFPVDVTFNSLENQLVKLLEEVVHLTKPEVNDTKRCLIM